VQYTVKREIISVYALWIPYLSLANSLNVLRDAFMISVGFGGTCEEEWVKGRLSLGEIEILCTVPSIQ